MKFESKQLYNAKEVKEVKLKLLEEQGGKDLLTGLPLDPKDSVLDHCHSTQYIRGVLHRQSNVGLGKFENLYVRFLKWWYPDTLPNFLRQAADYLERADDTRYLHPFALKVLQTRYNSLSEPLKRSVLNSLGKAEGSNATERKKLFQEVLKGKSKGYSDLLELITKTKENQ